MPRGEPVTDSQREHVRALHAKGLGRNEIAARVGLSTAAVTNIAKRLGLSFSRQDSAIATAARVRSLKERRADIVDRLYRRAEANLARLEAESFRTLVRGAGGAEYVDQLDFVPPEHDRALSASIQTVLQAASKLELQDADQGVEDARSLLMDLGRALAGGQKAPDSGAETTE